jgi:hypothetical protein
MSENIMSYPWYAVGAFTDLMQGDVILHCPLVRPEYDAIRPHLSGNDITQRPDDATTEIDKKETPSSPIYYSNVVIVTQSCDLANAKDSQVLVCMCMDAVSAVPAKNTREEISKGRNFALHMIEKCDLDGVKFSQQIIDFRQVYSLPIELVKQICHSADKRARLLPPYREHMAQAFARYFMRVGLPVNLKVE